MKILVAGHSIANYRQRIMWQYIGQQGHSVLSLCVPQYRDEVYQPIKSEGYELRLLQPYMTQTPEFWYLPGIHEHLASFNPDIIFCMQEPWTYFAYHLLSLAKIFRKPFAFFTWENLPKFHPPPWRQMDAAVVRDADLAICGNKDAGKILIQKGANRVEVLLQTGLDKELFVPQPKLHFDKRVEPFKLLYIGRLVQEKGIETILKAFDKLDDNYILRFVGGRGNEETIQMIKNHPEFEKRITLEPWAEHTTLAKVYNWADVTLMPSIDTPNWREQCGYVIGESLLCHVPVITTISQSIMEIWNHENTNELLFITQGDVDMLKTGIEQLVINEAKEGRQFVIENYSYEVMGDKYIKILEEII